MAADAPPTSYKDEPSLIEWDSLREEDQFKKQEEMTKFLLEPGTTEQFIEECRMIGQTAAIIEHDFRTVLNVFIDFASTYSNFLPNIQHEFIPRWETLMTHWNGRGGMLWSSKQLSIETVHALTGYGEALALIADIKTQSELEGAQRALRDYVANHPIDIASKVADEFKNLRIGIQDFAYDFSKYVADDCFSAGIVSLEDSIKSMKQCQETIAGLNEKIQEYVVVLGCSSVFGILRDIPVGSIGHYVVQRNETQANFVNIKSGIITDKTSSSFDGGSAFRFMLLRAMEAEFEKLKPNIVGICDELSNFANLWAYATEQSIEMNNALNEGMVVLTRKKFQLKLALLIAQVEPLREGLRTYAAQI